MTPDRDLVAHALLFAAVNAWYLVEVWPQWLWVTVIWGIGLAVHAGLVLRDRASAVAPDPDA